MSSHSANDTFNSCTFTEGPSICTVEYPLADVRLHGYKQWPVREPPQKASNEHAVVRESESESMEEYDRSSLGVRGIPVLRDVYHVLHISMPAELNTPVVLKKLMCENVTKGDQHIPK